MEIEKAEKLKQKQEKKSKANIKQEIKQKSKSQSETRCTKKRAIQKCQKIKNQKC